MRFVLTRIVIPFLITAGGVLIVVVMLALSGEAERQPPPPRVPTVEVAVVSTRTAPIEVHASGTVSAAAAVRVVPEVQGQIVWVSPRLRPGARFRAGEVLARVDATTYQAAVAAEEARVEQARLEVALEAGRREVAAREWALLAAERPAADAPLALRVPQAEVVSRSLAAAEASLARARRDLGRTSIKAPFNAVVVDEALDLGQLVGPGAAVATLTGTDAARVVVDLALDQVAQLEIPGVGDGAASAARVAQRVGTGAPILRDGHVVELLGQLDPQTRRAQVLVEIDDPWGAEGLPLLPGAFVDVTLVGRRVEGAVDVPREALVDGAHVWVVDGEGALRRREVVVGWGGAERVVVIGGLADGERVVTSPLAFPTDGMAVQVAQGGTARAER